eukprot:IDg11112t1
MATPVSSAPVSSGMPGFARVGSSGALSTLPRVASSLVAAWGAAAATDKAAAAAEKQKHEDMLASSGQKPPSLRRNESTNSVLGAGTTAMVGPLSRSNSFLASGAAGTSIPRGFPRTNSILSLLSGLPTQGMRESSSTDRLLGLEPDGDRVLATLKATEAVNLAAASAVANNHAGVPPVSVGMDRALSFGQLDGMAALADLDDPSSVAISLQEEDKWAGGA